MDCCSSGLPRPRPRCPSTSPCPRPFDAWLGRESIGPVAWSPGMLADRADEIALAVADKRLPLLVPRRGQGCRRAGRSCVPPCRPLPRRRAGLRPVGGRRPRRGKAVPPARPGRAGAWFGPARRTPGPAGRRTQSVCGPAAARRTARHGPGPSRAGRSAGAPRGLTFRWVGRRWRARWSGQPASVSARNVRAAANERLSVRGS